ncbi:c-type cytochrome [Streptomyces sp. NPDC056010]|uniref:c-type cytochrome n=1 Tax=Streptomyces sp. NPDC056010 TaxID=3345679 RepID=UPI0035D876DB
MRLPAEAVDSTVLIEVVRLSGLPAGRDDPYPGTVAAHWAGSEAAAALSLMASLPGSEQHRCGFSPGWSVRAYDAHLGAALFEAAFCFTCHEVRMRGTAVPPDLATQYFDPDSAPAQNLLSLFRGAHA